MSFEELCAKACLSDVAISLLNANKIDLMVLQNMESSQLPLLCSTLNLGPFEAMKFTAQVNYLQSHPTECDSKIENNVDDKKQNTNSTKETKNPGTDNKSKTKSRKDEKKLPAQVISRQLNTTNVLFNQFTKHIEIQTPSIPSSLLECTNTNLLNVALTVAQTINKNTKKPIPIDQLKEFITEQHLDGEALNRMDSNQFLDKIKKYEITSPQGRHLFNGIMDHWTENEPSTTINLQDTATQETSNHSPSTHSIGDEAETVMLPIPCSLEECNHEYMMRIVDILKEDDD
eukprot:970184_1